MYRNKEELVLDLAAALIVEVKSLESAGVTLLQIDEPILSTGIADLAVGKQAVEMITSAIRIPTCMHVCGNLANVIDELLKYNVNVLDFEFSKNPANLDILSRRDLGGRMLGYGCVDSASEEVETVQEIRKRIEKGVATFDPKIMLIDPDCGMRMRSRESAVLETQEHGRSGKGSTDRAVSRGFFPEFADLKPPQHGNTSCGSLLPAINKLWPL